MYEKGHVWDGTTNLAGLLGRWLSPGLESVLERGSPISAESPWWSRESLADGTPWAKFEVEPGAMFDLTSAHYAREYNEVKQVGDARVRGAMPDSEESFCSSAPQGRAAAAASTPSSIDLSLG